MKTPLAKKWVFDAEGFNNERREALVMGFYILSIIFIGNMKFKIILI